MDISSTLKIRKGDVGIITILFIDLDKSDRLEQGEWVLVSLLELADGEGGDIGYIVSPEAEQILFHVKQSVVRCFKEQGETFSSPIQDQIHCVYVRLMSFCTGCYLCKGTLARILSTARVW